MSKYIICDVASADHGKTTFLKEVIESFKASKEWQVVTSQPKYVSDLWIVFRHIISGKVVLVQTMGDEAALYSETIKYITNNNVNIILCARRSRGQTLTAVQTIVRMGFTELDFTHLYPATLNWSDPAVAPSFSVMSKTILDIISII